MSHKQDIDATQWTPGMDDLWNSTYMFVDQVPVCDHSINENGSFESGRGILSSDQQSHYLELQEDSSPALDKPQESAASSNRRGETMEKAHDLEPGNAEYHKGASPSPPVPERSHRNRQFEEQQVRYVAVATAAAADEFRALRAR